jgi:hypothetical protein
MKIRWVIDLNCIERMCGEREIERERVREKGHIVGEIDEKRVKGRKFRERIVATKRTL